MPRRNASGDGRKLPHGCPLQGCGCRRADARVGYADAAPERFRRWAEVAARTPDAGMRMPLRG